jgi:hypothetical protein
MSIGNLRIDRSDTDSQYLFLELDRGVGDISKKEFITLRVKNQNYTSQK